MNFVVCILVAAFSIQLTVASIPWSYSHSPFLHEHSRYPFPSYEADRNHIRAKYYAKRAHDLAKLRSSIYGIGYGLYGFRYGSHFPKHFSKPFPLLPFVTKYPIFSFDWDYYPHSFMPDHLFFDQHHYPSISEHLIGYRYPTSHHSSYSHSYEKGYSYEKGHSKGHEHSYGHSKPYHYGYHGHPSLHIPYQSKYIKKEYPGESIIYKPIHQPHGHSYEYAWEKKTPDYGKHISPLEIAGHDAQFTDIDKETIHGKFPIESIGYEEIPLKSSVYGLIPPREIELSKKFYEKAPYVPDQDLIDEKFSDLKSDDDFRSLNIDHGLNGFKFEDKDFIAHGSEKSERKIK